MVKYECELCNYSTSNKANYKKHCTTNKHKEKSIEVSETVKEKTPKKHLKNSPEPSKTARNSENRKIICDFCGNEFARLSNLTRHSKKCSIRQNKLSSVEKELDCERILHEKDKELHQKDIEQKEMYKKEMEYYKEMLNIAGGMVQKTVSALTYIVSNYDEAPPINKIDFNQIRHIKDKPDDVLISEIFYQYNNNKLGKYIGDTIVKVYKNENPLKQSIWNTDTSRSTYLLKKIIYDDKSKWIVDKKGVDTTECVISPIVAKIRDMAVEYRDDMNNDDNETSKIMIVNDIFVRLVADIDNKNVHKDILKYMSPYFYLSDDKKNAIEDEPIKKKKKKSQKSVKNIN